MSDLLLLETGGTDNLLLESGDALLLEAPRAAADYYIDAVSGSDSNSGLLGFPWQTSAAANSWKFVAGDRLFLNKGDSFDPLLIQLATGGTTPTLGNEITIGAYGSGANPIVNAGTTAYGIRVLNLPYTIVQDIEVFGATVTFTPGTPNTVSFTNTGAGIHFKNTSGAQLEGNIVRRCEVHGVYLGIEFGDDAAAQSFGFTNFEAYENEVHDCCAIGLRCHNYTSLTPGTNVDGSFHDNYIYNIFGDWDGATGGNVGYPLQIGASTGMLVERNVLRDSGAASAPSGGGPTGIIGAGTHDAIIRGNVILKQSSGNVDGAGIHMDGNSCVNNVIERNYISGCREGITLLSIGGVTSGTVIRYNIIQNAATIGLRIEGATGTVFHNNVIYQLAGDTFSCDTAFEAYNNIFMPVGGDLGSVAASTVLNGNRYASYATLVYNGNSRVTLAALQSNDSQEADGTEGSAGLVDAGNAPTTWTDPTVYASTLTNYDPDVGSAVIGAGLDINNLYTIDPGPADFHYLSSASWNGFNIGAVETSAVAASHNSLLLLGVG